MISIVLAGRNDDYGKGFSRRLFSATSHNVALLCGAGIEFEYLLAEWNPLPDRPPLSVEFVQQVPNSRAVIIPSAIHEKYSLNPYMPFHEMPAKNAALRRARGTEIIVTNADIFFGEGLIRRIAESAIRHDTLYRAHRIDVRADLSCEQITDPQNQLASGEGRLPPCYYMGAGGDFCLAARSLWLALTGFNERIRFSTRAKDWQFFLSAAAQGVPIEFIGDVYHQDHEGGFRNAPIEERNSSNAHFGGSWDIEFGLPVTNPPDWGFCEQPGQLLDGDERITVLDGGTYQIPAAQAQLEHRMRRWLTSPAGGADWFSAHLYHVICAAQRHGARLLCRTRNKRSLVALAGFQRVAAEFSVPILCNAQIPEIAGFTVKHFAPEPAHPRPHDWLVEEHGAEVRVAEYGGKVIDVRPKARPPDNPEFNPVMIRRLLRACLGLQSRQARRIAIYGAGSHTSSLLRWGLPDSLEVAAILVSDPASGSFAGLPLRSISDLPSLDVDAVLLSSSSFEPEMAERAREMGVIEVTPLYADWPPRLISLQPVRD